MANEGRGMQLPYSATDNATSRQFYKAGKKDDIKSVKELVKNNKDVQLDFGFLASAAKRYSAGFLTALLGSKSREIINDVDSNGWSALEFAVAYGRYDNAEILLKHGADPDSNSLITNVISEENEDPKRMLDLLLKYGADINRELPHLPGENLMTLTLDTEEKDLIDFVRVRGGLTPEETNAASGKRGSKSMRSKEKAKRPPKKTKFETYSDQVVRHFGSIYGAPATECIQQIVPGGNFPLQVHYIPYNTKRKTALLFTVGMGLKKIKIPRGQESFEYAELAISLPREWPALLQAAKTQKYGWPIQWLFNLANYIHGDKNWLDSWTVIANGSPPRPLAKGVKFAAWGSHIFESDESIVHLENGKSVGIFFLIPLFAEEYEFERENGVAMLMKRFGRKGIPITVDPNRKNVCK
ncbi:MAG: suppressor of fused domain protein [Pirellulaceae bacterium]